MEGNRENNTEQTSKAKQAFKKLRLDVSLVGILIIIIGIIMFIWPIATSTVFIYILGILLLIGGAIQIIAYLRDRQNVSVLRLILGIVLAFLGLWLMLAPIDVMLVICFVFAVYLIVSGIQELVMSGEMKRAGYEKMYIPIIFSIASIVFGIILLTNLFATVYISIKVIAIFLIIDGIFSLFFAGNLARYGQVASKMAGGVKDAFYNAADVDTSDHSGSNAGTKAKGGFGANLGRGKKAKTGKPNGMKNTSFKIKDDVQDAEYTEVHSDNTNEDR